MKKDVQWEIGCHTVDITCKCGNVIEFHDEWIERHASVLCKCGCLISAGIDVDISPPEFGWSKDK